MPLGIEPNNIAPQLIQNSGAALVQGIRQIGQQISGHLTEIQTKRDLGAMAQEMQGLNVQSNEFPVQLTQMLSRHPLAAKDDRGQMALSILGKAHGQWQAGEAEARAFNRAMAMQTRRTQDARSQTIFEEDLRNKRPVNVAGVGLVDPTEIDPVTGQAKVLAAAPPRTGSLRPTVLAPGAKAIDATGKVLAENPKSALPTASESRLQKKSKIDLLLRRDKDLQTEIANSIRRRDSLSQERMKITKGDDPNAAYLDNTVKAIEEEVGTLRKRRSELQKAIESIEVAGADEAAADDLGLPPITPGAAAMRQLDKATAAELLKQAGGDAQKARQLAKDQGYSF
jgi:hypothetical protein